jgi:L-iditol 2-dehydrogenase
VRAVVVGPEGGAELAEVAEPEGPGDVLRVLACGLCGSDVEKLDAVHAGSVLGHEVVAELEDGRRVALVHHVPCGVCERCLAGHESTCERFAAPTIRPGGLAERVRADAWVDVPNDWLDWRGTMVEPLACVLRGAARIPPGRVLIVGNGFVGRLFGLVLERRGNDVFAVDVDPRILDALRARLEKAALRNVTPVLAAFFALASPALADVGAQPPLDFS